MESGTPGVKSTRGRMAEPLPAGAEAPSSATPFRAVALTPQLPRMLQGAAPALAMSQIGAVRHPRRPGERHASAPRSKPSTPRRPIACSNGTGREAFDAMQDAEDRRPVEATSRRNGADYPRSAVRPGAAADRAADQSRTSASRSRSPTSAAGTRTSNQGAAQGQLANRLDDFAQRHRGARRRPRRSHGRHRRADDVGVRPRGERERQPRHRPRPRQRDDGDRRRRARRPGLRQVAGPRASSSATKAATSR